MNLPGFYPEKFINSSSQSSSALIILTHCLCGWFVAFASKTSNNKIAKKPRQYYKTRYIVFKGPFTNYVYKRRGVGSQKNWFFVNFYAIENINGGG